MRRFSIVLLVLLAILPCFATENIEYELGTTLPDTNFKISSKEETHTSAIASLDVNTTFNDIHVLLSQLSFNFDFENESSFGFSSRIGYAYKQLLAKKIYIVPFLGFKWSSTTFEMKSIPYGISELGIDIGIGIRYEFADGFYSMVGIRDYMNFFSHTRTKSQDLKKSQKQFYNEFIVPTVSFGYSFK